MIPTNKTRNRIWLSFVTSLVFSLVAFLYNEVSNFQDRTFFVRENGDDASIADAETSPSRIRGHDTRSDDVDSSGGDRPWMVLHVGPPKTGTTTIQHGFREVATRLASEDNVYFIGCVLSDIVRVGGSRNKTSALDSSPSIAADTHNNTTSVTMFRVKDFLWSGRPLKEFTDVLRSHQRNKHNVVVSSEILSSEFSNSAKYWKRLFRELFLSSYDSSSGGGDAINEEPFFGFNVKIVVTYRHFFQWLPSYWAEYHKYLTQIGPSQMNPRKQDEHGITFQNGTKVLYPYKGYIPGIIEYVEWFLHNITQYIDPNVTHTSYTQRFPNPTKGNEREALPTSHGSIWSYSQWSSKAELHDRVDVFDMHQQQLHWDDGVNVLNYTKTKTVKRNNLFADFVCQMLPTASNTCIYLSENTDDGNFRKRVNDSPQHTFLSKQDMHRIKQMAERKGRKIRNAPTALQVPSAIVARWFRKQERTNQTSGLKRCMGRATLERLKDVSWNFLLQQMLLLGKRNSEHRSSVSTTPPDSRAVLFRSSMATSHLLFSSQSERRLVLGLEHGVSWTSPIRAEHDRSFEEYVTTGVFCEIDTEQLFENQSFINYVLV